MVSRFPRKRHRYEVAKGGAHVPFQKNGAGVTEFYNAVRPLRFLEVMEDTSDPTYRKGLGKTDQGGELKHIKIELDLGSWSPRTLNPGLTGSNAGRRAFCLPLVPIPAMPGDTSLVAPAKHAYKMLRKPDSWDDGSSIETIWDEVAGGSGTNPFGLMEDDSMDAFGTTAINRVLPTNPTVDIATTVAEFISERKFVSAPGSSGSASGEYLNVQLAALPLYGTVKDLRKAMEEQDQILDQYERDAGRWIRRHYEEPKQSVVKSFTSTGALAHSWDPQNLAAISWFGSSGKSEITCKRVQKTTFDGAFTYVLPEGGWRRKLAELDQVYGITPSIDTAYEILPYSFVVDYFSNMGDVAGNLASFSQDGLVMPYGYVTNRIEYEYDMAWTGGLSLGTRYVTTRLTANLRVKIVQRRQATPFGFGFDLGNLTLKQGSILAALAMSALKR